MLADEDRQTVNKLRELEKNRTEEKQVMVKKTWAVDWEGLFKKIFRRNT